jgi:polyphosphate glucokinase
MKVLVIDIGGSHVKIMATGHRKDRQAESGPKMSARDMVTTALDLAGHWKFKAVSIGYPGPVVHGKPVLEPKHLAPGWVGFDFERAFGRPVKVVNDALMQAVGTYQGGRMLFLGLGTGLGSAMVVENVAQPMELAHLPYKEGRTFEEYLGEAALERMGQEDWQKEVVTVIGRL